MRLQAAIDLFLKEYVTAPNTFQAYKHCLMKLVAVLGGDQEIESITPEMLVEYADSLKQVSELYADHPTRPTQRKRLSLASINKHTKSVKRFFNWLVSKKYLEESPAAKIKKKKLPRGISRDKAMTDEELHLLLTYTWGDPRTYAMLLFIADTGCRAGGAADLQLENLHIDRAEALLLEKGDKARWVTFGEECRRALRRWLKHRPDVAHGHVFTGNFAPFDPMTPYAISQVIRRACIDLDMRHLGSHSLRHRKGHQLAAAQIAITTAADLLGHENIEITSGYYQESWDRVKEIGQQLAVTRARLRGGLIA